MPVLWERVGAIAIGGRGLIIGLLHPGDDGFRKSARVRAASRAGVSGPVATMIAAPKRLASSAFAIGIKWMRQPVLRSHNRRRSIETTVRPATKSATASSGWAKTAPGAFRDLRATRSRCSREPTRRTEGSSPCRREGRSRTEAFHSLDREFRWAAPSARSRQCALSKTANALPTRVKTQRGKPPDSQEGGLPNERDRHGSPLQAAWPAHYPAQPDARRRRR